MANADRLIELFNDAKARPAGSDRERFLAESCPGDPELKEQLISLLQAHEGARDLLKNTVLCSTPLVTQRPGDKIGRYKLLQQLGEGGCGVVYMAEQEEPVRRKVALKVIKLGMDTKQVVARFEAERQALALMDHPNIAKVFDAGATDTGGPYFVMELVRGIKITDYCDQHQLSTIERLGLFIQVCQAVQHAHQKGIIHRDIKPSNILVTQHDTVAVPKVIDFGIAKATSDQPLTDKTLFTAFEQFMGTPAYMSPEQARLSGLDIDTRTDIYSLGVLLYELLTGRTPFDSKLLLQAGLDEMRRILRETDPPRPSTRLQTLTMEEATDVARRFKQPPAKLVTFVRGDLDWIVMKALEKDRNRRYETANGFAMDIQRHLSNEPVVARPPTSIYRFQRLVRRNKLVFAAGLMVTATLVFGFGVSSWLFFREKTARRAADERASIIQAVSEFLTSNLLGPASENNLFDTNFKPNPGESFLGGLARAAANIGDKFKNQPLVEAKIRQAIGDAYSSPSVNQPALAVPEYERAIALRKAVAGSDDASTNLQSMKTLGLALKVSGRLSEAIAVNAEALRLMKAKHGSDSDESTVFMMTLADTYKQDGQHAEAVALYEELIAIAKIKPDNDIWIITCLRELAPLFENLEQFNKAEATWRESLTFREQKDGPNSGGTAASLTELGQYLLRRGRGSEAESVLRKSLRIREDVQPDAWSTGNTRSLLGAALLKQNKLAEAEPLLLAGYSDIRKREAEIPVDRKDRMGSAIERLVDLYVAWGKPVEATEWRRTLQEFNNTQARKLPNGTINKKE